MLLPDSYDLVGYRVVAVGTVGPNVSDVRVALYALILLINRVNSVCAVVVFAVLSN